MIVQSRPVLYNLKEGHQLGLTKSALPYPTLARGPGKGGSKDPTSFYVLSVSRNLRDQGSKELLGGDHGNTTGGLGLRRPFPKSRLSNNDQ